MENGIGNYQVCFFKAADNTVLYGKMFDTVEPALDYAHSLKGKWLMFKLAGTTDTAYAWRLLPYGSYKSYKQALLLDSLKWVFYIAIAAGLIYIGSKFFKGGAPVLPKY